MTPSQYFLSRIRLKQCIRLPQWFPSEREALWFEESERNGLLAHVSPGVHYGCCLGNWLSSSHPPSKTYLAH